MKTDIEEFKKKLKGLPKEERISLVKQELNNRGLTRLTPPTAADNNSIPKKKATEYSPTDKQLEALQKEIEDNDEAYESETKRKELIPFMYDRDLNWFFNAKNIPAQEKLVMPTYDYFNEGPGKGVFEPLDFFNLLEKQQKDVVKNIDKPFDILNNLKAIPLTEKERHTLLGFIIKWFGGYPVNNSDEQYNTVLRLIEKEFLAFPEHTAEKEFCSVDLKFQRKLNEVAAHLSAAMPGVKVMRQGEDNEARNERFPESHYVHKLRIDFEDLPHYVIQRGIIWNFENKRMKRDAEYAEWQRRVANFLNSIPVQYRLKALEKGIEYGKKACQFHIDEECEDLSTCVLNESWERRIALAEDMLKDAQPQVEEIPEIEPETSKEKNREFTTARQVLAIHYLLEYAQVRNVDATDKARFIQFLTGKETGAKNIQNTNIYKRIKSPLSTDEKTLIEDLQFIRTYFEKLGLTEISKWITNEISSKE